MMDQGGEKINRIKGYAAMMFFQTVFFASVFLTGYWIVTLNWFWISVCAGLVFLQSFIKGGWTPYSKFVTDTLHAHKFFPSTREYEEAIPEDENTLFSMHPHGIFTYGKDLNDIGMHSGLHNPNYPNDKFSNMIPLASRFILNMPIIGVHFKLWGMQSVDPKNLQRLMM